MQKNGKKRGRGAPPKPEEEKLSRRLVVYVTQDVGRLVDDYGGTSWVRKLINRRVKK